ncbi:MAG: hypothetical protein U0003_05750 [Vampirovibrionales bacterium]
MLTFAATARVHDSVATNKGPFVESTLKDALNSRGIQTRLNALPDSIDIELVYKANGGTDDGFVINVTDSTTQALHSQSIRVNFDKTLWAITLWNSILHDTKNLLQLNNSPTA